MSCNEGRIWNSNYVRVFGNVSHWISHLVELDFAWIWITTIRRLKLTKFEILLSLTLSSKWQNSAPGIRALDKIPLRMLKVNVFLSVMIFCTFELTKPSRSIFDRHTWWGFEHFIWFTSKLLSGIFQAGVLDSRNPGGFGNSRNEHPRG